jgi:hypothetical protein
MEHFFDSELWIVASNFALVVATGLAVWATLREGHRHEEVEGQAADARAHDLAVIVHEVLEAEKQEHTTDVTASK